MITLTGLTITQTVIENIEPYESTSGVENKANSIRMYALRGSLSDGGPEPTSLGSHAPGIDTEASGRWRHPLDRPRRRTRSITGPRKWGKANVSVEASGLHSFLSGHPCRIGPEPLHEMLRCVLIAKAAMVGELELLLDPTSDNLERGGHRAILPASELPLERSSGPISRKAG
jgi:hypothetical protein